MSGVWGGLMPKTETQALQFLKANPEYDGTGVIVGILDTGVDPASEGLQVCPDGRPKVIDVIDCSGSGDVHMSEDWISKDADSDTLTVPSSLLEGAKKDKKTLKLNSAWVNPTGRYRYASKKAFEGLYPGRVVKELKGERKKVWDKKQQVAEAALQNQPIQSSDAKPAEGANPPNPPLPSAAELTARIAALRSLASYGSKDPGPIYDCLVWHNGQHFEAAINVADPDPITATNVNEVGDFSKVAAMCDFRRKRQHSRFSEVDSLTYAVNIFDDGKVLSVVTDAGAHGTHVAGITAGYYPPGSSPPPAAESSPEDVNGVAPGAQIISLKIGDTRLDSMETGVGLVRAAIEAVRRGCHIVNMSYGEAAAHENFGYFVKLANDIVSKHNVIFVASAGNNGPALSTVGCPGGLSSHLISVAAMSAASLMPVGYGINQETSMDSSVVVPTNYTWSSVGPSPSGGAGVSIMAPGGAITCVPTWTKNRNQLMNGTSMSSPNACGCISLLLSSVINDGALAPLMDDGAASPINFSVIRRVVESSARMLEGVGVCGQGHGVIQVQAAHALLNKVSRTFLIPERAVSTAHTTRTDLYETSAMSIAYKVSGNGFTCHGNTAEGIYLRTPEECAVLKTYHVDVAPLFAPQCPNDVKTAFEQRVVLKCTYFSPLTAAAYKAGGWVSHTSHLLLVNSTKTMQIKVDPSMLGEGHHTAMLRGYMAGYEEMDASSEDFVGALFEVPITVVKAAPKSSVTPHGEMVLGTHTYSPGDRFRRFMVPPPGTSYVELFLEDCRRTNPAAHAATGQASPSKVIVSGNPFADGDGAGAQVHEHDDDHDDSTVEEDAEGAVDAEPGPGSDHSARLFVVHGLQLVDGKPYSDHEDRRYIYLKKGDVYAGAWAVVPGVTMEVCISRYWSTLAAAGEVKAKAKIVFRGVHPSPAASNIVIAGGSRVGPLLTVQSMLQDSDIAPQGKLTAYSRTVRPSKAGKVTPLGERDVVPADPVEEGKEDDDDGTSSKGTPLYQLVLEYTVPLEAGNEATPTWPGLQGVLYESRFHCQFYSIYHLAHGDKGPTGRRVGCGDAFPAATKIAEGGTYLVRLHIRHPTITLLEGLTDLPLVLKRALPKPIPLSFYSKKSDCLVGGAQGKLVSARLNKGKNISFYVKEPTVEASPAPAAAAAGAGKGKAKGDGPSLQVGDVLTGKVSYLKDVHGTRYVGKATGASVSIDPLKALDAVRVTMVVADSRKVESDTSAAAAAADAPAAPAAPTPGRAEEKKEEEEQEQGGNEGEAVAVDEALLKAVLDAKVKYLASLIGKNDPLVAPKAKETPAEAEHAPGSIAEREAKFLLTPSAFSAGDDKAEAERAAPTKFSSLYETLKAEAPDNLPVRLHNLKHVIANQKATTSKTRTGSGGDASEGDVKKKRAQDKEVLAAYAGVLAAGEDVLAIIDTTQVAATLGLQKPQEGDKAGQEARKAATEKKAALQEVHRTSALAALYSYKTLALIGSGSGSEEEDQAEAKAFKAKYEGHLSSLQQWDSLEADAHWWLWLQSKTEKQEWGSILKRVQELLKKESVPSGAGATAAEGAREDPDVLNQVNLRRELLACLAPGRLGWGHISQRIQNIALVGFTTEGPDR